VTTFGNLQIAASAKIEGVGLSQSERIVFHWPWYWHLSRLGPWLLLALAIAVPRRNRDRRATLIFVPLVILTLLWPVVAPRVSPSSANREQSSLLFESLVVGLALLWLNADTLRRHHGLVRFPMALGLLLLGSFVTAISSRGAISDPLVIVLLMAIAVMGAILLGALALARRVVHRRYVPLRFMLWLAAGNLLITTAVTILYVVAVTLLITRGTIDLQLLFLRSVVVGLALGLCLYAVNLPYMLLMFTSPFFRRRFHVWLGVRSLLPPSGDVQGASGL
jgi:hypothetical protein